MRMLVALSRFPWPLEKGDKLRAWQQLQGLARNNEVHLVCLNESEVSASDLAQLDFCASVKVIVQGKFKSAWKMVGSLFNDLPFQVNYYRSEAMREAIAATIREQQIEACLVQLVRICENLPMSMPCRWVLDYQDAFSIGMSQRAREAGFFLRPFARSEARRLLNYETRIAAQFDELVIISERDAAGLAPLLREVVHIIPNGVSESFFEQGGEVPEKQWDLIFFGNMGYQPNVQSARWLVEEVLPLLHARGLRPKLCFAGARPAAVIKGWAGPDITVTGFVDDLRYYLRRSRVSVAPLVAGQGLQNKLLESMAMGMPTITTPISNAALGARDGEELLVREGATAFADAIEKLLADPEGAAAMAARGRAFVEQHFRWESMNLRLEAVLKGKGR